MATLGANNPTFADWARRVTPEGSIESEIIELLGKSNPIIQDATVLEGNLPTGHRTTQRLALPSVNFRALNEYVGSSKSTTRQVDDACGLIEAFSKVDKQLAALNGNSAAWRFSEDQAFIEAMNQKVANEIFYGDAGINPRGFTGLTPRFNSLSSGETAGQVVDGGSASGQTDNTSIWFVSWSPSCLHLFYPKGGRAGLETHDMGEQLETDSNGNNLIMLVTNFIWKMGLSLRDPRYVARIANIDVSELSDAGASGFDGANLINLMIDAYRRIVAPVGRGVIYCNRTVLTALDKLAANKVNMALRPGEYAGQPTTMFWQWPIRTCDAISNAEARIT